VDLDGSLSLNHYTGLVSTRETPILSIDFPRYPIYS
jgi:hypothetical protein